MNLFPNSPGGKPCPVSVPATRFRALHLSALWRSFLAPPCGLGSRHVWLVVLAAMLVGCGSGSDSDEPPGIIEFSIVGGELRVAKGEAVRLRWSVYGDPVPAVTLTDVTYGPVQTLSGLSGTVELVPEGSGSFTLLAVNRAGQDSATRELEVFVAPVIEAFEFAEIAEDGLFVVGGEYRVEWEVSGEFTQILLDGEAVGPATGGMDFVAGEDRTHELRVSWAGLNRTVEADPLQVAVLKKPVIQNFDVEPGGSGAIDFGLDVEFTWKLTGGAPDSIFITEEGGGVVAPDARSYIRERVTNTITQQLEVRNRAGTAEAELTIHVDPASVPYGLVKVHNGRVVVMRPGPVSGVFGLEPEYVPVLRAGIKTDALAWLGGEFYRHFADVFDFLIFVGSLTDGDESVYVRNEWPWVDNQYIFSDEPGLGREDDGLPGIGPRFSKTFWAGVFGSGRDELRGVSFHPYMGDVRGGPSLREVIRHWGLPFLRTAERIGPCDPSVMGEDRRDNDELCVRTEGYVSEGFAGFSSNNGQLGGFDGTALTVVEPNYFGEEYINVYRAGRFSPFGPGDNSVAYSEWELYAAGMVGANEVRSTLVRMPYGQWHLNGAFSQLYDDLTGDPLFVNALRGSSATQLGSGVFRDTIQRIVQVYGERMPESPNAAQLFVGAVVLVVDGVFLPDDAQLDALAVDVSWLSNPAPDSDPMFNFFEATGGRGQLLLEQLEQHRLQVPLVGEGLAGRVQRVAREMGIELP